MHFEVPKSKSFKEFGGEYLMIVISILTALALESVVEKVHHNHLAHEAAARMDAELRINADEVKSVLAHNEGRRDHLIKVHGEMLDSIRNKISETAWRDRFEHEWKNELEISFQYPTLRSEAWDAAIANQAVTFLPQAELTRYASAYGNVRDITGLFHGGLMSFFDGPRVLDTLSNTELGVVNREELYRTVNQMILSYNNIDGNLKDLEQRLQAATGSDKPQG